MGIQTLLYLVVVSVLSPQVNGDGLSAITSETGFYQISVNNKEWLRGSQTFFYASGDIYTTEGRLGQLGNLTLRNTEKDVGKDQIGVWKRITYNYFAGDKPIQLYIKSYTDDGVNVIIFGQKYVEDTHGTKASNDGKVIGGFPNFDFFTPATQHLGFLSFGGNWLGDEDKFISQYDPQQGVNISDGFTGGPVCMFDPTGNTLIVSPFNQFMSASSSIDNLPFYDGFMHWGIMGNVDFIPAGFDYQTIMYYGKGINKAFEGWGEIMKNWYNKTDLRSTDITLNNVGYWTDEGTAYYEQPEEGKDYEDTILDLKANIDQLDIPYKYIQLDNWFYERDEDGGTVTWKAKNDSIPDGLTFLHEKTGLPVVLQNGFWSNSTPYAVQNGGNYTFLMNGSSAVPLGEDFWDFLFSQAKSWGLTVYQQDWMVEQTYTIPEFQTNVTLGRQWLMDMGKSASRHGITIQYSGALPRHALQSLEIPAVTQARVSTDYNLSPDQWKIGVTSMFADALGLAPFKDAFLSTDNTTNNETSHKPTLESIVATLSKGPVGPGDAINNSNLVLASKNCCNKEGLILGPSKPATAIDLQIMEGAYNNSMGPKGELWTTYSMISDYKFGIIFSSLQNGTNFTAKGSDLFGPDIPESKWYTLMVPNVMFDFSPDSKVFLCCNDVWPFYTAFYTAPVFRIGPQKSEVVVLGEMWKDVPMSPNRIQSISVTSDNVTVVVTGVPAEMVTFFYTVDGSWKTIQWTFPQDRQKTIVIEAPPVTTTIKPPTTTPLSAASLTRSGCYVVMVCIVAILRLL